MPIKEKERVAAKVIPTPVTVWTEVSVSLEYPKGRKATPTWLYRVWVYDQPSVYPSGILGDYWNEQEAVDAYNGYMSSRGLAG